jgi:hypothetical protein
MIEMKHSLYCFGVLLVGCVSPTDTRVAAEPNTLGVVSIETSRSVEQDDRTFELRGLDANGHEVGSVRLRVGTVAGLPGVVRNDDHEGSEIVMSVAGRDTRTLTREMVLFELPAAPDIGTQTFLEIPTVARLLAKDANIIVAKPQVGGPEIAFTPANCPTGQILTSPEAYQCCYDGTQTLFTMTAAGAYPPSWPGYNAQTLVKRTLNPHGTGCKASDGVSGCNGSACYYGPLGYAKAVQTVPGNFPNYYWNVLNDGACFADFVTSSWNPAFTNEYGSAATNQGCPGSSSGDGLWDY